MGQEVPESAGLKRSIGLAGMVFYGVGTMIGGGIYALLGKVIGLVGVFAPLSLLLAGAVALVSALSFAELSRRFPVSAGEMAYVQAAFGMQRLSQIVGGLVILTGVVSSATLCAAVGGFLLDLMAIPATALIALTAAALTAIAAWGVTQSVLVVGAVTLVEAGTLLAIILFSAERLPELPELFTDMATRGGELKLTALMAATFLSFYAFIGFEDMVNMAEEVRDVERNLPLAIFIAVGVTIFLYLGVTAAAITLDNRQALATAHTPLALLLPEGAAGTVLVGVISVLAGLNGALVQIIMATRVIYGMARQSLAPAWLGWVHPRSRTPVRATVLVGCVVLFLATNFPLTGLAQAASFIILVVFTLVNLSLAALRWREKAIPWLPGVAALSCLALMALRLL